MRWASGPRRAGCLVLAGARRRRQEHERARGHPVLPEDVCHLRRSTTPRSSSGDLRDVHRRRRGDLRRTVVRTRGREGALRPRDTSALHAGQQPRTLLARRSGLPTGASSLTASTSPPAPRAPPSNLSLSARGDGDQPRREPHLQLQRPPGRTSSRAGDLQGQGARAAARRTGGASPSASEPATPTILFIPTGIEWDDNQLIAVVSNPDRITGAIDFLVSHGTEAWRVPTVFPSSEAEVEDRAGHPGSIGHFRPLDRLPATLLGPIDASGRVDERDEGEQHVHWRPRSAAADQLGPPVTSMPMRAP